MAAHSRKGNRQKFSAAHDLDAEQDTQERFGQRSKHSEQRKIERTAQLREAENAAADVETLPIGQVVQVFSLYAEVVQNGVKRLCVVRKTLRKLAAGGIVVGDWVRFRDVSGAEAVIEQVLPRQTILTRAGSFKSDQPQPIVANAQRMLIVASVLQPRVKWGLVDRMIVAAKSGGLEPIVCINKIDLATADAPARQDVEAVLQYLNGLGIGTLKTSAQAAIGLAELADLLKNRNTVLAGHSGVGKSSLISRIQAGLDIRTAPVSAFNEKGRHTTTSARIYDLSFGGAVIDTPGVRVFGLWDMTPEKLEEFYPDVTAGSAPPWRIESYQRLAESLGQ